MILKTKFNNPNTYVLRNDLILTVHLYKRLLFSITILIELLPKRCFFFLSDFRLFRISGVSSTHKPCILIHNTRQVVEKSV